MAATNNAAQFNLGLKKFGADAEKGHRALVRAVALRALRGVVLGTRVDTGRMRGNWQVTQGAPAEGYEPDAADKRGAATIAKGNGVIGTASGRQIIWLHNGVPYAKYVNEWDKIVETTAHALRTWLAAQAKLRGPG